ncbi:MAG: hypothetical protein QOF02_3326 [Blastocatellia bacterium]|jgi:hypothetical protein|nr:hypothetical protein [Blastocatellia bacterium]
MKKTDRKRFDEALDKALAPPRRMPKQSLDSLLEEYDDGGSKETEKLPATSGTAVPQYRSINPQQQEKGKNKAIKLESPDSGTAVPEHRSTGVPEHKQLLSAIPTSNFYRKSNEVVDQFDRELTPAESKVFDHLLRLSVGFNKEWCQVRITTLQQRTGYRSDKTVRAAINGLVIKGRIERRTHHNNPLGDEYQILNYSDTTEVPQYRSTPVKNTPVLESKITGHLNTSIKDKINDDDAFADFVNAWREAAQEVTGRETSKYESERWRELAELLITELKIAAARTTVSSVPSFLAEHLRRRLWKVEKKQAGGEAKAEPGVETSPSPSEQARNCPDCGGSGLYYPEGYEKGVAKCAHKKLKLDGNSTPATEVS